ncbi:hypothetical protein [Okeania sp. KiyG1]|uniref:hypothetical protein n=1 Tax=Okeania sp. KiyG1 TaxID=2720165 RepID=UPI0019242E14|nr:hypothetical protein [Okeania sp. KiyG1]GGA06505.1 hypothetical protein CYANOKiyG1_18900 [Okeania sp. KiyG1]
MDASHNENILALLLGKTLENPLTEIIFPELHKMKMLVIFHWGEMDGKILRTTSIYLWVLHRMKSSGIAHGEDSGKSFGRNNFSGASQDENIGDFPLGRDGWENFENNKHIFMDASHNENILALLMGKIPQNPLTEIIFR